MTCKNCGTELPENAKFCTKCGTPMPAEEPDISAAGAERAVPRGFSAKKNIIIIIIAAILLIGGGITAIAVVNSHSAPSGVSGTLQLAERYLSDQNYEQAVIEFQKVLEIEPMNVDAYLGLADAYLAQSQTDKAIEILEVGLEKTGDDRIKSKLDELTKKPESSSSASSAVSSTTPVSSITTSSSISSSMSTASSTTTSSSPSSSSSTVSSTTTSSTTSSSTSTTSSTTTSSSTSSSTSTISSTTTSTETDNNDEPESIGALAVVENPDAPMSVTNSELWLVIGYGAFDFGIDYSKVAKLSAIFTVVEEDREFFDGQCAGSLALAINNFGIEEGTELWNKYFWSQQVWWGVKDDELGIDKETEEGQDIVSEKIGDYTYKITSNVFDNPLANGDFQYIDYMGFAVQEWGVNKARIKVLRLDVMDESSKVLMSYDSNGKCTVATTPVTPPDGNTDYKPGDTFIDGDLEYTGALGRDIGG